MKENPVWIVEMYSERLKQWIPTTDASFTRSDGRYSVERFKKNNPDDRFRLRKYLAKENP